MIMGKTLEEKLAGMPAERRAKIEARTAELIAEEKSLRDLRRARTLTQKRIAKKLGIGQESVSKLESRSDLMISTLRNYVEAMGGKLSLVAEFPDRPPVSLSGFKSVEDRTLSSASRSNRKLQQRERD
jgi:transcriptional regulator with XRE-family HTH domain